MWDNLRLAADSKLVTYKKIRILVPRKARKHLIKLAHDEHLGSVGIACKVCKRYYWSHLKSDVPEVMADCEQCKLDASEID